MGGSIEAAGGVLWRAADTRLGVEIALVHRPAHGDWSLPKGKLRPGEHPILGALREVAEETGHTGIVGPHLGASRYSKGGAPKRVRYWAMESAGGTFRAGAEVDDLVWLPPDAALVLARDRDHLVIDRFQRERPDGTWPLLLVRHAKAVASHRWAGADRDRPLDRVGRRQADALVPLLGAYGVRRALTPDVQRCRETVLSRRMRHGQVEWVDMFARRGKGRWSRSLDRVSRLAMDGVPTVVCANQQVLIRLCTALSEELGRNIRPVPELAKAGLYALHLSDREAARASSPEKVA
jgi:8-oxo-(d)GTP phosphatase